MINEPMINVKYPTEVIDFLAMNCERVEIDGIVYHRPAPFWYTQTYMGDANVLSVYTELPKEKKQ